MVCVSLELKTTHGAVTEDDSLQQDRAGSGDKH